MESNSCSPQGTRHTSSIPSATELNTMARLGLNPDESCSFNFALNSSAEFALNVRVFILPSS